ncbi:MAG: hypothetical protein FK734_15415 [Asgard group archaeon]|nr:hypothetical protein [Asgard group archaeon]
MTSSNYSVLERNMLVFRIYLALFIFGLFIAFGSLAGSVILILNFGLWGIGISLAVLAFIVSPFSGRLFIRYIRANNAYKRVNALKKKEDIKGLMELTNVSGLEVYQSSVLKMLFSIYALIDLNVKDVAPILIEQYSTAKENNYPFQKYQHLLQILAGKIGYESYEQLIEEYNINN